MQQRNDGQRLLRQGTRLASGIAMGAMTRQLFGWAACCALLLGCGKSATRSQDEGGHAGGHQPASEGDGGHAGHGGDAGSGRGVEAVLPETPFDVIGRLTVLDGEEGRDNHSVLGLDFTSYFVQTEEGYTFVSAVPRTRDVEQWTEFVEMELTGLHAAFEPETMLLRHVGGGDGIDVHEVTVSPVDDDGDGIADGFAATLRGKTLGSRGGDVTSDPTDFVLALQGSRDETAPQLLPLRQNPLRLHPLDDCSLWASEPLSADTRLSLVGEPELPLITLPRSRSTHGALLEFSAGRLGWFSREWLLEIDGSDLSGKPLRESRTIRTLSDPGVFAEDGFEGPLLASGSFRAVEENAIAGMQSLEPTTFEGVTLHLARNGRDTVRFSVREERHAIDDQVESYVGLRARALVVGTQDIVTYAGPHGVFEGAGLGPVIEVELPLEAEGDDVIVHFDWDWEACTGYCETLGLVIDELRME
jgi:hypothetical protein